MMCDMYLRSGDYVTLSVMCRCRLILITVVDVVISSNMCMFDDTNDARLMDHRFETKDK